MTVTFRDEPLARDVEAVRALVGGTGFFRPDEIDVAVELVEERLAKGAASGYYFCLADAGDALAGYVCFGPIPCTIGSFDLYWIAVDASRQGQGLGLQLVASAENSVRAMGGKRMYIETSGQDLYRPTQAFYEKAGYFRAAELPDFYDVGDAKIIYQKNLDASTGVWL